MGRKGETRSPSSLDHGRRRIGPVVLRACMFQVRALIRSRTSRPPTLMVITPSLGASFVSMTSHPPWLLLCLASPFPPNIQGFPFSVQLSPRDIHLASQPARRRRSGLLELSAMQRYPQQSLRWHQRITLRQPSGLPSTCSTIRTRKIRRGERLNV